MTRALRLHVDTPSCSRAFFGAGDGGGAEGSAAASTPMLGAPCSIQNWRDGHTLKEIVDQ